MKVWVEFNLREGLLEEFVDFLETCLDGTGDTFEIKDSPSNDNTERGEKNENRNNIQSRFRLG